MKKAIAPTHSTTAPTQPPLNHPPASPSPSIHENHDAPPDVARRPFLITVGAGASGKSTLASFLLDACLFSAFPSSMRVQFIDGDEAGNRSLLRRAPDHVQSRPLASLDQMLSAMEPLGETCDAVVLDWPATSFSAAQMFLNPSHVQACRDGGVEIVPLICLSARSESWLVAKDWIRLFGEQTPALVVLNPVLGPVPPEAYRDLEAPHRPATLLPTIPSLLARSLGEADLLFSQVLARQAGLPGPLRSPLAQSHLKGIAFDMQAALAPVLMMLGVDPAATLFR